MGGTDKVGVKARAQGGEEEMNETEYLIVGGGPAGLGAACRLQQKNKDWRLLEAEDHVGGLSSSFVDEKGFTWDLGGHVQFSHYSTFDRYMDGALGPEGWLVHERESWIWVKQRFVPYPFQSNLHRLDPGDQKICLDGLEEVWKRAPGPVANFEEWMLSMFGRGVCDLFMRPYNFKVWAHPPAMMDYRWFGDRVAVPDRESVLRAIRTNEDHVSWGPNRLFRFPKSGGTGAIWKSIGATLDANRVSLSCAVERIEAGQKVCTTADGIRWKYRCLISTMPLDDLIRKSDVVDHGIAGHLLFSTTHLVGVGMEGQPPDHLKTKCWMYFPEANSPYYRITVFTNYSPNNASRPGRQWSLMTETSESRFKPVEARTVAADTLRALQEDHLLQNPDSVCALTVRKIPKAYPTPFLGRDAMVDPLLRRFEECGIFSRGRFGAWKYEVSNMDHSFAQGYECAERLACAGDEACEPTLFTPHVVNAQGRR